MTTEADDSAAWLANVAGPLLAKTVMGVALVALCLVFLHRHAVKALSF